MWSDPDESGAAVKPEIGVAAVARHLREFGVHVSPEAEGGASFIGQLQGEAEVAIQTLADYLNAEIDEADRPR